MNELIINGKDAYKEWGVRIGDGFFDNLEMPASMKEVVYNDSRNEHGLRTVNVNPKFASREITLTMTVEGISHSDFRTKKLNFINELCKGDARFSSPKNNSDVYTLEYLRCTSYSQNYQKTFCKMAIKFREANPTKRA